jgi:hypothetical protein
MEEWINASTDPRMNESMDILDLWIFGSMDGSMDQWTDQMIKGSKY